jgi:hypothetical protein
MEMIGNDHVFYDEKNFANRMENSIIYAIQQDKTELLEIILNKNPDLANQSLDNNCNTALYYATFFKKLNIMKLLVEKYQVNIDAQNNDGSSCLHLACKAEIKLNSASTLNKENSITP